MDVGKLIVLAVSLSIVGSVMASTIFTNFAASGAARENYTGILAIVMPFVPVVFGLGVFYVAGRELGIVKQ